MGERKIKYIEREWLLPDQLKPLIGTLGQRPKNGIKTNEIPKGFHKQKGSASNGVDSGLRTQK